MNIILKSALAVAGLALATQAAASVVFYENENFSGRSFTAQKQVVNFERTGFNDRSSSVVVFNERWEVCEHAEFGGKCVVLRPGRYASLGAMGLNDRVSSVRIVSKNTRVDNQRYAPVAVPVYDNRRRGNERLHEAKVTSVRAVGGTPQQRCWMEREQVSGAQAGMYGPGSVFGYYGPTARNARPMDVQRCETTMNQNRPDYWEVTYDFKGQQHRMQMSQAPGATVTVNGKGEPRA